MATDRLPHGYLLWLTPPVLLGSVGVAVVFILGNPLGLWGWAAGGMFALGLGWLLVTILWPAHADRTCPQCGENALERRDPASTVGLVCRACGHVDDEASGWLLAEEEGPLESIVLEQRGRAPAPSTPAPDRTRSAS